MIVKNIVFFVLFISLSCSETSVPIGENIKGENNLEKAETVTDEELNLEGADSLAPLKKMVNLGFKDVVLNFHSVESFINKSSMQGQVYIENPNSFNVLTILNGNGIIRMSNASNHARQAIFPKDTISSLEFYNVFAFRYPTDFSSCLKMNGVFDQSNDLKDRERKFISLTKKYMEQEEVFSSFRFSCWPTDQIEMVNDELVDIWRLNNGDFPRDYSKYIIQKLEGLVISPGTVPLNTIDIAEIHFKDSIIYKKH